MIRSVCLVSREYPPATARGGIARITEMTARALADQGVATHVISLAPVGVRSRAVREGVAVHRVAPPANPLPDSPEIDQALWAATVARRYRELDAEVGFDAVLAPDRFGEAARIELAPGTVLVTELHAARALVAPDRLDPRRDPALAAASELERLALRRSDGLVAPTKQAAERTLAWLGSDAPPVDVLPVPFDTSGLPARAPRPPRGAGGLELVFVGRLEAQKGPDLALRTLAALGRRGLDVRLTVVGRDTPTAYDGASYRTDVLVALMAELGLGDDRVRFVGELDLDGVTAHLAAADAALLPSRGENVHLAAVEALACGLPVVCGADSGLTAWVAPEDGLWPVATDDPAAFAAAAADRLGDRAWLDAAGRRGAVRVREVFDPATAGAGLLELLENLAAARRPPTVATGPWLHRPKLGVVVLAHNALPYTRRCVASLLHHTAAPMRLVVVDNASTDGTADWLRSLDDERVRPVELGENRGVPGGRNAGLDHLDGDEDWIVFLDNDTEVMADWWRPFVEALEADPEAGIAGEDGVQAHWDAQGRRLAPVTGDGVRSCDIAVGFAMVMRPTSVTRIGRFDTGLGLFWHDDDDYAMRAARIGERVLRVASGRVLHYEHRSSQTVAGIWDAPGAPAELSRTNQRYLAQRRARHERGAEEPILVAAHAAEALAGPEILRTFRDAFTADDPAALVVWGPGREPAAFEGELRAMAADAGFDLEGGPRLVALLPPEGGPSADRALAEQATVFLTRRRLAGELAHLGVVAPGDADGLRVLAARSWRARRRAAPAGRDPDAATRARTC